MSDHTPEYLAARRLSCADGGEREDERILVMGYEVTAGIPWEKSPACSTAEDEAISGAMMIEVDSSCAGELELGLSP